MSQAQRYANLAELTGNRPLDCSYHAAFYLLSYDPEIYETAKKCVTVQGIEFAKVSRLGYPYMELACTACYIAAGQMEVVIEPETDSIKLDDKEYQKTQRIHEKMARLYANMEIAGSDENSPER